MGFTLNELGMFNIRGHSWLSFIGESALWFTKKDLKVTDAFRLAKIEKKIDKPWQAENACMRPLTRVWVKRKNRTLQLRLAVHWEGLCSYPIELSCQKLLLFNDSWCRLFCCREIWRTCCRSCTYCATPIFHHSPASNMNYALRPYAFAPNPGSIKNDNDHQRSAGPPTSGRVLDERGYYNYCLICFFTFFYVGWHVC